DALDRVQPGDTIVLVRGVYYENIETKIDGEIDNRITVRGPVASTTGEVILRGTDNSNRLFQVHHDYYTIEHFTIDGELEEGSNVFIDKLLFAHGEREPRLLGNGSTQYLSAVDGLIIRNMNVKNAGGECIRLRYFVTFTEIYDNIISGCGIHDFRVD
ncbi:unnamed protein product, partial [Choristocarpus tenellus]